MRLTYELLDRYDATWDVEGYARTPFSPTPYNRPNQIRPPSNFAQSNSYALAYTPPEGSYWRVHMQEAIPGIKATARINGTGTTTTIEHLTNVCVTRFLMIERFGFACLGFNPERLLNREGLMKDMLDTNEMLRAVLMLTTNESTKVGLVLIMIPTSTQVLHGLTKPPYSQSTQSWNGSWNTDANWNQSWSSHWWSASSY